LGYTHFGAAIALLLETAPPWESLVQPGCWSQVIGVPGFEFESEKFNWLAAGNISDVLARVFEKRINSETEEKQPFNCSRFNPSTIQGFH
jgi:hypothetical protein